MRIVRLSMLVLLVAIAPLSAQINYYLPEVIDGPIASTGGSVHTTIVLSNTAAGNATINIALTGDDGAPPQVTFPDLGAGRPFAVTLKPGSTRILQTSGNGDGLAVAATISSTVPIGVSTLISVYDGSANLVSESGIGDSAALSRYVIPVDSTLGVKTGVALFNPNATASTVTFTVFDTNGTMVKTATRVVAAGGHSSRLVAGDLFSDVTSFRGTMLVSSTAPVAAVAFRQNASAAGYTLLQPEPQTALPLWHYFPQLANGPSGTATLQTSFLLYNLSDTPATVTVKLSQDSAVPWLVNIPGVGTNNTVKLAPGGSAFLQTDGQGVYATGAATITSDQPVGATTVVTASDGNGNFIGETGMGEAPSEQTFLMAFDTSNNPNTGAAFFNPTSRPVILHINLLDSDGNLVASTQSQPLAARAHLAAYIQDWFPGTSGMLGTLSITAGDEAGAIVSALALRQNSTALGFASVPSAALPVTSAEINVTPALDGVHKVSGTISPSGGSLSLTDAKGNKFTLKIPANALINSAQITMTPLTSLSGLPEGGTFNAGVQLEPDGLVLFQPALLTFELASAPAPDTIIPLGWHGAGQGAYLNFMQPQSGPLTMALTHFSGAGIITGTDSYLTTQLLKIGNSLDFYNALGALWANKLKRDGDLGNDLTGDLAEIADVFSQAYTTIEEFMQLARDSQDDDVLRCAAIYADVVFDRQRLNYNRTSDDDPITQAITKFVQYANRVLQQHASDRCTKTHDPLDGLDLLGLYRQAQLNASAYDPTPPPDVSQCLPNPVLSFQSEISDNGQLALEGLGTGQITFDGQVSAKVILSGRPPEAQRADGYASFPVTGSAPLKYDKLTAQFSTMTDRASCVAMLTSNTGSTLTILRNSEIQYQYTPKFQPTKVLSRGQTIASFCPAYDKSPVSVTLLLDPGEPRENFSITCTGSAPIPTSTSFWLGNWNVFHPAGTTIAGWQIPGSGSFAHKEYSQNLTLSGGISTTALTEKTKLDLNQP